MAKVIDTVVSILVEVRFPMSLMHDDAGDRSEDATRMDYAARLEQHPHSVWSLLEDRMVDYGQVLRVDVQE